MKSDIIFLTRYKIYLFCWRADQTNYWRSKSRRAQLQALHTTAYVEERRTRITFCINAKPGFSVRFFDGSKIFICKGQLSILTPCADCIFRITFNHTLYFTLQIFNNKKSTNAKMLTRWTLISLCLRFREHFNKLLICKSSYEEPFLVRSSGIYNMGTKLSSCILQYLYLNNICIFDKHIQEETLEFEWLTCWNWK